MLHNSISAGRWAMAGLYIVAGSLHFLIPEPYRRIMPTWLPAHAALVAVSGAAEMAGGIGLLLEPTRPAAAIGLVLLLICVMPANWFMATHPGLFPQIPQWALWARLPLQLPLILWAAWYIRHR